MQRNAIIQFLILIILASILAACTLDEIVGVLNFSGADAQDGYITLTRQAATAAYGATAWADQLIALTPVP